MTKWSELWEMIETAKGVRILRHVNPDPDAYGSQYALAHFLRDNFPNLPISCDGEKVERLSYLFEDFTNDHLEILPESQILTLVLDTANVARIDSENAQTLDISKTVKIDHHPNRESYGQLVLVDEDTPATCAILLDEFLQKEKNEAFLLSSKVLECLYAGLVGDTGNFSYGKGLNQAFFCNVGVIFERIETKLVLEKFFSKTPEEIEFLGYFLSAVTEKSPGFYVVELDSDITKKIGVTNDFATGLVNKLSEVDGAKVWATFLEDKDNNEIRCSLRSRFLVVNTIAEKHGGGGHPQAAGIRVKSWDTVCEIQNDVKELLAQNE